MTTAPPATHTTPLPSQTTLTEAQIATAVRVAEAAIARTGTNYVNAHYPFLAGLVAPNVSTIAQQAAIAVVNDLVLTKVLP